MPEQPATAARPMLAATWCRTCAIGLTASTGRAGSVVASRSASGSSWPRRFAPSQTGSSGVFDVTDSTPATAARRPRRTFWSVWRLRRGVEELVRDGDTSYTAASDAARAGNERGDGEYVLRAVREAS